MSIVLIVNADDFGLTRGVNSAVLACHLAGSVTSTTLMANMDAAEEAAAIAHENPSLGVGLHFNLTAGRPISIPSRVRSLVDSDDCFFGRGELLKRALRGQVATADLETEFEAQWNRLKALGLRPTHVDSHQHIHMIPQVFQVISRACAVEGIPLRLTWRWPGRTNGKSLRRRLSESVLHVMTRRCASMKPIEVRANEGLCSVFDIATAPRDLNETCYRQLLDAYAGGVVELMVHPAEVDDELSGLTEIAEVSAAENRLLRSDFLKDYVQHRQGRLGTYRDLWSKVGL